MRESRVIPLLLSSSAMALDAQNVMFATVTYALSVISEGIMKETLTSDSSGLSAVSSAQSTNRSGGVFYFSVRSRHVD